jgi:hypothetical protein
MSRAQYVLLLLLLLCRQLMEQYGFMIPGNPLDRVQWPQELLQDQHGWMSHKAVKTAAQQVLAQQLPQLLSQPHVDAAVASILQHRGWKNAQQYKATTLESTARCAKAMLACLQQQLRGLPTSAADDLALLQQLKSAGGEKSNGGERLRAAVQYRADRKLLLQAAAEVLQILAGGESRHESWLAAASVVA